MLFSFFRTQPGIELGHPRTLYPDKVIRNTIGHVGSTIYVVNDVQFIYHSLLTLYIYAIYIYSCMYKFYVLVLCTSFMHKLYVLILFTSFMY